ncbi:unnamed protein product [Amoebophrya sp. A120]|nr:unnamed protein product [Amoebophrya sp. A120]|eukprot:GSA120T00004992001.1
MSTLVKRVDPEEASESEYEEYSTSVTDEDDEDGPSGGAVPHHHHHPPRLVISDKGPPSANASFDASQPEPTREAAASAQSPLTTRVVSKQESKSSSSTATNRLGGGGASVASTAPSLTTTSSGAEEQVQQLSTNKSSSDPPALKLTSRPVARWVRDKQTGAVVDQQQLSPRQQERLEAREQPLTDPNMDKLVEERGRHIERTKRRNRSLTPEKKKRGAAPGIKSSGPRGRGAEMNEQQAQNENPRVVHGEGEQTNQNLLVAIAGDDDYFVDRSNPSKDSESDLVVPEESETGKEKTSKDKNSGPATSSQVEDQSAGWFGSAITQLSGFVPDFSAASPMSSKSVNLGDENTQLDLQREQSPPGSLSPGSAAWSPRPNGQQPDALDFEAKDEMIATLKASLREKADRCDRFEELLHEILQVRNDAILVSPASSGDTSAQMTADQSSPVVPRRRNSNSSTNSPSDVKIYRHGGSSKQSYDGPAPSRPGRASPDELNCLMQATFSAVKNMREELETARSDAEEVRAALKKQEQGASSLRQKLLHTENVQREVALLQEGLQTAERLVHEQRMELDLSQERILMLHQEAAALREEAARNMRARTGGGMTHATSDDQDKDQLSESSFVANDATSDSSPRDGATTATSARGLLAENCHTLRLMVDAWYSLGRARYRAWRERRREAREAEANASANPYPSLQNG